VSTLAGNSASGDQNGHGINARFNSPSGVEVTPDGNTILVADTSNHKIRTVCMLTQEVGLLAGNVSGYQDGDAGDAFFNSPADVAVAPDGLSVLIADRDNNRIRKLDMQTRIVSTVCGGTIAWDQDGVGTNAYFDKPTGIVITPDGTRALVADRDNNKIRSINLATRVVTTLSGSGTYGYVDSVSNAARFASPLKIILTSDGAHVLVTDQDNHKIRKVSLSTGYATTLAGSSEGYENGDSTAAKFSAPAAITLTPDGGTAIVGDSANLRIRTVNLASGEVGLFAGNGGTNALRLYICLSLFYLSLLRSRVRVCVCACVRACVLPFVLACCAH
jgi:DNA-binding beta-propeller fold protein YncE